MNTELVLTIENSHCLNGLGDSLATTDKNAIDIEGDELDAGSAGFCGGEDK